MPFPSKITFCAFVACLFICPLNLIPIASTSQTPSSSIRFRALSKPSISVACEVPGPQHRGNDIFKTYEMLLTEHLVLNYQNRRAAATTNALLKHLDGDQGEPGREIVRTCTVEGDGVIANWTLASSALSKIHNLEEVHWQSNTAIPAAFLLSLEASHPSCKLYYDIPFSNWNRNDPELPPVQMSGEEHGHKAQARARLSLTNSSALYSLNGEIQYGQTHNPEDVSLVYDLMTSCPNVRELELSIKWGGGCLVGAEQPYGFNFSTPSGIGDRTMAPLEVLVLNGYSLDGRLDGYRWMEWQSSHPVRNILRWPWKHMPDRVIHYIGYDYLRGIGGIVEDYVKRDYSPLPDTAKINLDGWLEHMDWSNLHTLQLDSGSPKVIEKLKHVLVSLKSFSVAYGNTCSARSYFDLLSNTAKPLESIHLHNVMFENLDPVIDMLGSRHNNTLTSFILQEWDGFRKDWDSCWTQYLTYQPHAYLLPRHLQQLRNQCPNISSLEIDLNRTSLRTVDQAVLDVIPTFANLSSLTLRLESPDMQSFRLDPNRTYWEWKRTSVGPDRIVNKTMVSDLFSTIRQKQGLYQHMLLSHLEIFVGNWREHHSYGNSGAPRHLVGRWTCSIEAQGREVCSGRNKLESDFEYDILGGKGEDSDDEEEQEDEL